MGLGFVLIVLQGIVYHGQADLRVQQRRTVQRKRIIENAQARMMCRVWSTLMEDHIPEVVFLSKTLCNSNQLEVLSLRLGLVGQLSVDRMGHKGGLGLLWLNKVLVSLLSFSNFHFDVEIHSMDNKVWRFTGFYGQIRKSRKTQLLDQQFLATAETPQISSKNGLTGVVWSLKPMLMQFGDVRRLGRNAFIHSGSGRLAEGLIAWALGSLKEFQISNWLKLNADVVVRPEFGYIGLSTIIRDSAGWVVAASYKSVQGSFSVDARELLALRDGLLLAKRMGCSVQLVESDFSNAIGMVSNVVSCFRDIGCVIFDVKALCEEVGVVTCCVISRFRNGAAYSLAVLALSSLEDRFLQNICLIVCCPLL
ncbi:hypothetical protein ACOSQ4_014740 [Xanthoceras sorbifolium]